MILNNLRVIKMCVDLHKCDVKIYMELKLHVLDIEVLPSKFKSVTSKD